MPSDIDFSRLTKEDVKAAFGTLPKDSQVKAVVEAMEISLREAKDFDELIEKIGKWAAIVLQVAAKLL